MEDKYDGIRAQAHVSGDEVKIFSRTRDEITESFPELPPAFAGLSQDVILDGEIVAWEYADNPVDATAVIDEPVSEAAEIENQESRPCAPIQRPAAATRKEESQRPALASGSSRISGF